MSAAKNDRPLRPGDVVEVRPAAEILATLDENGSREAIPFMPEMLRHVGRRFTVSHRVEKICDTAAGTYLSRRMRSTVLLEDLRCDGSGHGGCQAGCRMYWKEAWLRRVDSETVEAEPDGTRLSQLEQLAAAATTVADLDDVSEVTYRCQATEALAASEVMSRYDLRQYAREVTSGNVGLLHLVWVLVRAVWLKASETLRLRRASPRPPMGRPPGPPEIVGLRPGELVQIRPRGEIAATLDEHGKNRGLWFDDAEMARHCGETHRVVDRVERLIDESNGKMIELSGDCLVLEGVCCSGELTPWRWFCPRGINAFWREAWLRRVDESEQPLSWS